MTEKRPNETLSKQIEDNLSRQKQNLQALVQAVESISESPESWVLVYTKNGEINTVLNQGNVITGMLLTGAMEFVKAQILKGMTPVRSPQEPVQ